MKHKTKIFYMGRQINGRFDSFKARVRRAVRMAVRVAFLSGVAAMVFFAGALSFSTNSIEVNTRTVQAQVVTGQAPVLDRIADCESGNNGKSGTATQWAKNGQVLMHWNQNGTVDVGKYAINATYWGAKATELGYDLTTLAGNKAMAEWIYANKGTGDWSASAKCWNR